ncbi:MAG: DUF5677 domain-containing protein [Ignavibacteria bacterium]|nr:DUF5677 domain-containing protein [Ignavibacteria bacterium]
MIESDKEIQRLERQIKAFEDILEFCISNRMRNHDGPHINLALIILGNDIKEIAKSVLCLFKNNLLVGIDSLNRIALEKLMYLKLVYNNELKSKAFYLKIQLKRIELINNLIFDEEFLKSYMKLSNSSLDQVKKLISMDNVEFQDMKQKMFDAYKEIYEYDINDDWVFKHTWYNFDGKTKDLFTLAQKVQLKDDYRIYYELFSQEVHSKSLGHQYKIVQKKDSTYLEILDVITNTNKAYMIMYLGLYIDEVIVMFFERYRIPKKMSDTYYEAINL